MQPIGPKRVPVNFKLIGSSVVFGTISKEDGEDVASVVTMQLSESQKATSDQVKLKILLCKMHIA